jgi:DNA-directed RNA polymerase specialized sigma24 family protein
VKGKATAPKDFSKTRAKFVEEKFMIQLGLNSAKLFDLVSGLPNPYREVLLLELAGETPDEIGRELSLNSAVVRRISHDATMMLRGYCQNFGLDVEDFQ